MARRTRRQRAPGARRSGANGHGLPDYEVPARYRRLCQQLAPRAAPRLQPGGDRSPAATDAARPRRAVPHAPPRWRRALRIPARRFPAPGARGEGRACSPPRCCSGCRCWRSTSRSSSSPELSGALFDPVQLAQFEAMYDPADPIAQARPRQRHRPGDVRLLHLEQHQHRLPHLRQRPARRHRPDRRAGRQRRDASARVAGHLQAVGHGDPFWRFVVRALGARNSPRS